MDASFISNDGEIEDYKWKRGREKNSISAEIERGKTWLKQVVMVAIVNSRIKKWGTF